MFTIRNAVIVALMQIGVIVAGVLGAGVSRRAWTAFDTLQVPDSITFALNYGPISLIIPVIWILMVLKLRQQPEVSEDAKNLAFISGIGLLVLIGLFIGHAVLEPWLSGDWSYSGAHE